MSTIGPTILLVDNAEAHRCALRQSLQAAGFQVQEARDGRRALELAELQPDLILLDIHLPDLDGFEVCRCLKRDSELAHIPVIHMSSVRAGAGRDSETPECAADDYIIHSISCEELVAKLKAWLRVRRAETELRARNAELHTVISALRASEQEYRAMFEMAGVGKAQADADGRFLRVNRKFCEITGYSEDELLHLSLYDISHPDDRQAAHEAYTSLLRGDIDSLRREKQYVRKDGSFVWVSVTGTAVRDSAGRATRCIAVIEDITERKRGELALREREQQLATVLAALPVAVYIADAEGRLQQANPAADRLWDSSAPLVVASEYHRFMGWSAITGEPLHSGDWALQRAIREGEMIVDQEIDIETFDGSRKTILASALPIRTAAGRILGGVAVNVDITHRKRMERELSEAKELVETRLAQFHATINSMTEGVCFFDAQGEALLVNDAFFHIYGFDPACLPESTRKMRSLLQAYDLNGAFVPHSEWPVFAALRGEVVRHRELRVRRVDTGSEVILRHNAAPVRDAGGKPVMAVVTIEDVTAIKQAEQALVRSEKLASVGRMAATVAHEINNPLAAVMNTIFLARSAVASPESVHRYLDLADAELKRIAHITRQALGFYREPTKPVVTSVIPVLDSAIDLLKSKIKAKHVKIERQFLETPPVLAISGELRQVFSNLLANSLDAVEEGAVIKLRVSQSRFGPGAQHCIRVTVADNGRGIAAAALPHIFEPFFTTKESLGTGLGLWVSKQIIEKHGGALRVHSATAGERRGTAFTIFLPATADLTHNAASA